MHFDTNFTLFNKKELAISFWLFAVRLMVLRFSAFWSSEITVFSFLFPSMKRGKNRGYLLRKLLSLKKLFKLGNSAFNYD